MQKGKGEKRREIKAKRKNRLRYSKVQPNKGRGPRTDRYEAIQVKDLPNYSEEQKLAALKSLSDTIMQNPEARLHMLKDLYTLLQEDSTTVLIETMKKLCDIFIDIMPSYKIRVDSKEEESKLSKEVFDLRKYESTLLENYAKYLQILQAFLKVKSRKTKEDSRTGVTVLKECALICLCRLLENLAHINYTRSIMLVVVGKLCSNNLVMRERSMEAVKDVLSSIEHSGGKLELKLQTAKAIGKLVKAKSHKLFDRKLLSVFQEHRVVVSKSEAQSKMNPKIEELQLAIKKKRGKGKKKEAREIEKSLLKELKETSAISTDAAQINRYNTEILREILGIYLSILKDQPNSPLLMSVFEGLPHFAPHIDVEIVSDCLSVIRSFLKTAFTASEAELDLMNLTSALNSALRITQSLGSSFDIDERSFISYAYKILDYFITLPSQMLQEECCRNILSSIDTLFIVKKQLSMDVVAAFCKKLSLIALHLPENNCLEVVQLLEKIFKKYSRLQSLLDWDESAMDVQVFIDRVEDPQMMVSAANISISGELAAIKEKFGARNQEIGTALKAIQTGSK